MKKTIWSFSPISMILKENVLSLPCPTNISYMWNFGSLLGMNMAIQIISGIFLSMHYLANDMMAFESIMHILRNSNLGWMMKLVHMNGASLFFVFIYLHISRGLMFSSFSKKETWSTGVLILLILMATAFMGYVLPWGQMSFWGATVITNLISAIPWMGEEIVKWIWGGFSVNNATLNRFFTFHFLLPFVLVAMMIIHIVMLHEPGSSNPLGVLANLDKSKFNPFFTWKDMLAPSVLLFSFFTLMMIHPLILGDPENFNLANPMLTPVHIQPEWYFLFAYAILRAIPNKLGGVISLIMSILVMLFIPLKKHKMISSKFMPKKKAVFWVLSLSFLMLTWSGAKPIEVPFEMTSIFFSLIYFLSIIMI